MVRLHLERWTVLTWKSWRGWCRKCVYLRFKGSDEVINYENNGGYDPNVIYNTDGDIRQVLMQLINGTFSDDTELFRDLYDSLLNTKNTDRPDRYFILADFRAYAEAQKRVEEAYRDEKRWAKMALLNTANSGKFTSDRTIQEYVDDIWKLDKVIVDKNNTSDMRQGVPGMIFRGLHIF